VERSEYAKRLERVRGLFGLSLRAWWDRLKERGDLDLSYESVRQYHQDREPTVSYLVAVAKTFHISLIWLISGEGPILQQDDQGELVQELFGAFQKFQTTLEELGPDGFTRTLALFLDVRKASPGIWEEDDPTELMSLADVLVAWMLAPIRAMGTDGLSPNQRSAYLFSLISAILAVAPWEGKGRPLSEVTNTWEAVMGKE